MVFIANAEGGEEVGEGGVVTFTLAVFTLIMEFPFRCPLLDYAKLNDTVVAFVEFLCRLLHGCEGNEIGADEGF